MKKLMIAAAAVAVGFAAQAANVTWGTSGIQITGDFEEGEGNFLNNGLVYLVDGSVTKDAILAAVQGAADADARATYLSGIALDTAQVTDGDGAFMKSLDAGEAESLAARLVMFDASTIGDSEYFMISDVYDASFTKALNWFDYDGESWVNALDYSTAGAAGSNWQAVATSTPEPTSGLLLLLGVAGLALRRRRA